MHHRQRQSQVLPLAQCNPSMSASATMVHARHVLARDLCQVCGGVVSSTGIVMPRRDSSPMRRSELQVRYSKRLIALTAGFGALVPSVCGPPCYDQGSEVVTAASCECMPNERIGSQLCASLAGTYGSSIFITQDVPDAVGCQDDEAVCGGLDVDNLLLGLGRNEAAGRDLHTPVALRLLQQEVAEGARDGQAPARNDPAAEGDLRGQEDAHDAVEVHDAPARLDAALLVGPVRLVVVREARGLQLPGLAPRGRAAEHRAGVPDVGDEEPAGARGPPPRGPLGVREEEAQEHRRAVHHLLLPRPRQELAVGERAGLGHGPAQVLLRERGLGREARLQLRRQALRQVLHAAAAAVAVQDAEAHHRVALGRAQLDVQDVAVLLDLLAALPAGHAQVQREPPSACLARLRAPGCSLKATTLLKCLLCLRELTQAPPQLPLQSRPHRWLHARRDHIVQLLPQHVDPAGDLLLVLLHEAILLLEVTSVEVR
mmetsp:Transcript_9701/g.27364  ORF Transcript_9701/g.27364 Transcript_9701/m.27364 type:complete len:486 (-) Transcript_9701:249-1706(-)